MTADRSLEDLVQAAIDGDRAALERVVARIQHKVYGLALRMLGSATEAQDCTQEILIRVVTRLSSYRGQSRFSTWVYRIASNYLIDSKRGAREHISFEELEQSLGQEAQSDAPALLPIVVEETFLGCTLAMLRCLDRDLRLSFILGAILELESAEAATILGIAPAAFRKRLSRARGRLDTFLRGQCGLVSEAAACRCSNQVAHNIERGLLDPKSPRLATAHPETEAARLHIRQVGAFVNAVELFRRHPDYRAPADMAPDLRLLVRTGALDVN